MKSKLINIFSIIIIGLFLSIGCNILESNNSSSIIGIWIEDLSIESYSNLSQRLEYTFDSNNTFKSERIIIDSDKNIIGYRHISNGFYSVSINQLILTTTQTYEIDQQPEPLYVSKDELKQHQVNENTNVKFTINNNVMIWEYSPCPPNANCIGTQVFTRLDE